LLRWATLVGQLLCILLPTLVLVKLRHHALVEFFRIKWPEYREVILTFVGVFSCRGIRGSRMQFLSRPGSARSSINSRTSSKRHIASSQQRDPRQNLSSL
jgi:hypothetical protein